MSLRDDVSLLWETLDVVFAMRGKTEYTTHDNARFALVERVLKRPLTDIERFALHHLARRREAFAAVGMIQRSWSEMPQQHRDAINRVAKLLESM